MAPPRRRMTTSQPHIALAAAQVKSLPPPQKPLYLTSSAGQSKLNIGPTDCDILNNGTRHKPLNKPTHGDGGLYGAGGTTVLSRQPAIPGTDLDALSGVLEGPGIGELDMAGVRMLMHDTLVHDMVEMDDSIAGVPASVRPIHDMDDSIAGVQSVSPLHNIDDSIAGVQNSARALHDMDDNVAGMRDVEGVLDMVEMLMHDMLVHGMVELHDVAEVLNVDVGGVLNMAEMLDMGEMLGMAGVHGAAEVLDMAEMLGMGEMPVPGLPVLGAPEPHKPDIQETPELDVPEPLDPYTPEKTGLGIFEPPDLYIPKPPNRYIPGQSEVLYSPEELQAWGLLAGTLVPPSGGPQRHPPACNGMCKGDLTGPHMCTRDSRRRLGITCRSANCSAKFADKCAFNRHCKSVHELGTRVDCEYVGCNRVGGEGFSRRDNMLQHMRDVHGVDAPIRRYQMRGRVQGYEH